MTESMVEKVARAIALEHLDPETRAAVDPEKWFVADSYYDLARAAIEAMREPTEEMVYAYDMMDAWDGDAFPNAHEAMMAMIDAALKEQEKVG